MNQEIDEYEMIRDQARRFLDDAMHPEHLKTLLENPGSFDRKHWGSAVELGWTAVSVAEEHGGLGLGWRGVCVLAGELGRKAASLPLVASATAADLLFADATNALAQEYAGTLVNGERFACLALAQPGEAGLARAPTVRMVDGRLTGKTAVTAFAATADVAVVPASFAGTVCLTLVTLDQPGVKRDVAPVVDNSRAAAVLEFSSAKALLLATGAIAIEKIWRAASLGALATAFEQVGGAQACLEMARDYALERKAFGQQIGRFQSIKAKLADMYVRIEMARGCALDALAALEAGEQGWLGLAASARVGAIDAYEVAARENIQTHGAIGVTWEAMPHHHYRRSRSLALELGATVAWRERLLAEVGLDAVTE